jgi:hypothetical protein
LGACLVGLAGEHSEGIFGFRRTVREQVEEVLRDSCSECVCSSAALGLSSGLAQFLDCQVAVRVLARRSCPGVIRVGICVRKRGARSAFDIWIKSTTLDDILKSGGLSRKGRNAFSSTRCAAEERCTPVHGGTGHKGISLLLAWFREYPWHGYGSFRWANNFVVTGATT